MNNVNRQFDEVNLFEMKLQRLMDEENDRLNRLKQEYSHLPKSTLRIKKTNGYMCAYEAKGKQEKGIGSDRRRLKKLARKLYLEREIMLTEKYCRVLKKALNECYKATKNIKERQFNMTIQRTAAFLHFEQIAFSEADLKWKKTGVRNNYMSQDLEYISLKDELLRSKSELMIANRLDYYGVLYKCEPRIYTENHIYYPDFLIKLKDGRIIMWEHFGREDLEEYRKKSEEKIKEYRGIGFTRNVNLICTYEENTKSEKIIDDIIKRYLL